MAETQRSGVSVKSPTVNIVDLVPGAPVVLFVAKLAIGVSQKTADASVGPAVNSEAAGVSLKSPTVITSCTKEPAAQGMGVSLKVPTVAIT